MSEVNLQATPLNPKVALWGVAYRWSIESVTL